MAEGQLDEVLRFLRRVAGVPEASGQSDDQLLWRFVAARDEIAFTTLVQRHGPLVWGLCRRILGRVEDAEDVFQATFLVLARKAATTRWGNDIGPWLYRVASRLVSELRAKSARQRAH